MNSEEDGTFHHALLDFCLESVTTAFSLHREFQKAHHISCTHTHTHTHTQRRSVTLQSYLITTQFLTRLHVWPHKLYLLLSTFGELFTNYFLIFYIFVDNCLAHFCLNTSNTQNTSLQLKLQMHNLNITPCTFQTLEPLLNVPYTVKWFYNFSVAGINLPLRSVALIPFSSNPVFRALTSFPISILKLDFAALNV